MSNIPASEPLGGDETLSAVIDKVVQAYLDAGVNGAVFQCGVACENKEGDTRNVAVTVVIKVEPVESFDELLPSSRH